MTISLDADANVFDANRVPYNQCNRRKDDDRYNSTGRHSSLSLRYLCKCKKD